MLPLKFFILSRIVSALFASPFELHTIVLYNARLFKRIMGLLIFPSIFYFVYVYSSH